MAESGVIRLFPGSAAARQPSPEEEALRIVEAILFAAAAPVSVEALAERLPAGVDVPALLARLQEVYAARGVNLVRVAGKWAFRTAPDLAFMMSREAVEQKRLSRAAMETLAIIAYHQPVTRADIEAIRGVSTSRGAVDVLLEAGWIRIRGRRKSPGRPVTFGTTDAFLDHFGLDSLGELPRVDELKAAGLLDAAPEESYALPGRMPEAEPEEDADPLGADWADGLSDDDGDEPESW